MILDFDSFGDHQRIFKLNAQVSDSAVHLGMPQKQLDRPQIAGLFVDLRHFGASHRMRAIGAGLQSDGCHRVL